MDFMPLSLNSYAENLHFACPTQTDPCVYPTPSDANFNPDLAPLDEITNIQSMDFNPLSPIQREFKGFQPPFSCNLDPETEFVTVELPDTVELGGPAHSDFDLQLNSHGAQGYTAAVVVKEATENVKEDIPRCACLGKG